MFDPGQPCLFHEKYYFRVVGLHMLASMEIAVALVGSLRGRATWISRCVRGFGDMRTLGCSHLVSGVAGNAHVHS